MDELKLQQLLDRCRKQDRSAQKALYQHFYNYGMTICSRYGADQDEAKELYNDGFLKVFTNLDGYKPDRPFRFWLKRILVNTTIDRWRQRKNKPLVVDISQVVEPKVNDLAIADLGYQELMKIVQKLPPVYRMVFNMHVIEGYKHHEIADKLGIQVGTSKSNLVKARKKLQVLIEKHYGQINSKYGS